MITRLPTKFGQGHSDAIGFFQDVILPLLIENKIVCLGLRGFADDGTELNYTMIDCSGERMNNARLLGLVTELQHQLASDLEPKF